MRGDVNERARRPAASQAIFGRLLAHEHACAGEERRYRFDLLRDVRRARVGDAHDQRLPLGLGLGALRAAQAIHARTGRVRDRPLVGQKARAVEQRMKRHVVQQVMGHDDEVLGLQLLADRRDKRVVQLEKMHVSRVAHPSAERGGIRRTERQVRELELKQP